jgi:hypothetical protein
MSTELKSKDGMATCGAWDLTTGEILDIKLKNNHMVTKRRNWFQRTFIDPSPETYIKYIGIGKFSYGDFALYGKYLKISDKLLEIYFDEFLMSEDNTKTITDRRYCDINAYLKNKRLIILK